MAVTADTKFNSNYNIGWMVSLFVLTVFGLSSLLFSDYMHVQKTAVLNSVSSQVFPMDTL